MLGETEQPLKLLCHIVLMWFWTRGPMSHVCCGRLSSPQLLFKFHSQVLLYIRQLLARAHGHSLVGDCTRRLRQWCRSRLNFREGQSEVEVPVGEGARREVSASMLVGVVFEVEVLVVSEFEVEGRSRWVTPDGGPPIGGPCFPLL